MTQNLLTEPRLQRTIAFADGAHSAVGQMRKYTGDPYIIHPVEVCTILMMQADPVNVTEDMLHAAILHDVLEDTSMTAATLRQRFGINVTRLVRELTGPAKLEDGNRAARVAINRAHTALASPEGQSIKLADLISNTKSIVQHDPAFARIYLPEKIALLEVLREGDSRLYAMAERLTQEGLQKLRDMEIL